MDCVKLIRQGYVTIPFKDNTKIEKAYNYIQNCNSKGLENIINTQEIKNIILHPTIKNICDSIWGKRNYHLSSCKTHIVTEPIWQTNYPYEYGVTPVHLKHIDVPLSIQVNIVFEKTVIQYRSSDNKIKQFTCKKGTIICHFGYLWHLYRPDPMISLNFSHIEVEPESKQNICDDTDFIVWNNCVFFKD